MAYALFTHQQLRRAYCHTPLPPKVMSQNLRNVILQAEQIILGKPQQIRLALACLLARGHLLIEDLPGVGKTTLAHGLARTLGLQFQRPTKTATATSKSGTTCSCSSTATPRA